MRISIMTGFLFFLCTGMAGALEAGDATRGRELYGQCRACHTPEQNSIGPKHCGVVGREAASLPDFDYSPAMRKSGLTWTPEALDRFLQDPAKAVPGNFMPFGGISDARDRADLIAYLATLRCPS